MIKTNLSLDKKLSIMLMDMYSQATGLSIVFKTIDGEPIYSPKKWPEYCQEIIEIIGPDACEMDSLLYLFNWNEIPGKDNGRLLDFLNQNYGIDWVKKAEIEKIDGNIVRINNKLNSISLILDKKKNKVNFKIGDGRQNELIVKTKDNKLNIYKSLITNCKGLYQCPSGLWCYSQPVTVNGDLVGIFVVGHRRIKGREEESKNGLKKMLINKNINNEAFNKLEKSLEKVDLVEKKTFDTDIQFLKNLSLIEQYIIVEHQHAIDEQKRSIAFKNEAVSLAHEFLLPIQAIIADAENLLIESKEKDSELKKMAQNVINEVVKLSHIAENIRGSVLEENKKIKYEFSLEDIYPIIQDTIILFQKEAYTKDIAINGLFIEKQVVTTFIEMSKPHIRQVFFNLIHNAVKYSYKSTEISRRYIDVRCFQEKKFLCFEISNFGVGIEQDEISNGLIFQDGYRGKLSRDRSRIGSGFGLGRVKEIIVAHNGFINVTSERIGFGKKFDPYKTTFKIGLPLKQTKRNFNGT